MVPFKTFRGPLFPKPVTGQELFFAVSYIKLAIDASPLLDLDKRHVGKADDQKILNELN